jgi:tRNA(Ile)-lysidine synthase
MNLLQRFKEHIKQQNLFHPKDKLLLAVSGGIDSVVLCELCKQAHYDFIIAHCNFQLRGEESKRDEEFVKALGTKYETEVFVKKFDTEGYAVEKKVSIQEAARDLRYSWFSELLTPDSRPDSFPIAIGRDPTHDPITIGSELPTPAWLLTAHHADDNVETVLMNFFKGTGIAGLRGILPKQGKIIRPLLFAKKDELIAFANTHSLNWVDDISNISDKYSRNYFRHQVIPLISNIYPEAINNVNGNIERFRDIEVLYDQAIAIHKKKLLEYKGNEIHIPVLKLKKSEPLHTIIYEVAKEYGFTPNQVNEVIHLLDSETGKYISSHSHRLIKNRNWLIITPKLTKQAETILIETGDTNVQYSADSYREFNIQFSILETTNNKSQATNSIAWLDADLIVFPLLLRPWKQGDYFYPLGMKKKKKLARFFIDQKLSKTDKEKIWVLEMDKKIVWVIDYRIDDRFKITDKTKTVLKISISSL